MKMIATVETPDPDLVRLVQYIHTLGVGCQPKAADNVLDGYQRGVTLLIFFVPSELRTLSMVTQALDEHCKFPNALLRAWQQVGFIDLTAADYEQMMFFDLLWRAPICVDQIIAAIERVRYRPFTPQQPKTLVVN
jgi:hypothetical protein